MADESAADPLAELEGSDLRDELPRLLEILDERERRIIRDRFGLEGLRPMLLEEGLPNVFARHQRHGEATRRAARAWGLEVLCANPAEYSPVLTAILTPDGHSADALRKVALTNFNMSLGQGLGKVADKVFRIGHLGDFNDLSLLGTLGGVEMSLELANIPHRKGGVQAAMEYLARSAPTASALAQAA